MNYAADICEIGRRMYQRELVASNDGNISIRIYERRRYYYDRFRWKCNQRQ